MTTRKRFYMPRHPYRDVYMQQRRNAHKRNIEFQFTFQQWLDWWGDDISKRGKGKDKLCMARCGDTGPYHPSNVYKSTHADNSKVAPRNPAAASKAMMGKHNKRIKTPGGKFPSQKAAAIFHNIHQATVSYHIKKNPTEWYYY